MKKIMCKSLSIFLAVIMLFTAIPMLVSAETAEAPEFAVEKVSETETSLELVLKLTSGSFLCFDASVTVKNLECTMAITTEAFDDFIRGIKKTGENGIDCENPENGKVSVSVTESCTAPMDIVTYTFKKNESKGVNGSDVSLVFDFCYAEDSEGTEKNVTENIKAVVSLPETHVHAASGEWITVTSAKCKQNGKEELYCTECGEVVDSREIPMTGHINTKVIRQEPTCTEDGFRDIYCLDCGEQTWHAVLPAPGHDTYEENKKATCTENGYHRVICNNCKEVIEEDIYPALSPATGHSEEYAIEQKAATCTENGYVRYCCTRCGEVFEENVIPSKGHKIVDIVTPATCHKEGCTEKVCSLCHEVLSSTPIPKTTHRWGDWHTDIIAEPGHPGLRTRKCEICGDVQEDVIPAPLVPVQGIEMSVNDVTINYKKSISLYADPVPATSGYSSKIVWKSSNTRVATVDENGFVTATGRGTAVITASTADGKYSDTCNVTVTYSWLQYIIIYVLFGWIWY